MPQERVYRRSKDFEAQDDYIVEGYAALWEPYVLFKADGVEYNERIDKEAFKNADMSDVIFQFDHSGMVFARQSNETLKLEIDDVGLKVIADLSKTAKAREMHEDIKSGNITAMSWAFTVEEDAYNSETRTQTITKVDKVYDVSCVSIPANDKTSISARTIEGVINEQKRSERAHKEGQDNLELRKRVLRLRTRLEGDGNED